MAQQVVLVAFVVDDAHYQDDAQRFLLPHLPRPVGADGANGVPGLDSWWVASDERIDGSDNDSAVFVHMGAQKVAARLLHLAGLTGDCNLVQSDAAPFDGVQGGVPTTETPERLEEMVAYLRSLPAAERREIAWALGEVENTRDTVWTRP